MGLNSICPFAERAGDLKGVVPLHEGLTQNAKASEVR